MVFGKIKMRGKEGYDRSLTGTHVDEKDETTDDRYETINAISAQREAGIGNPYTMSGRSHTYIGTGSRFL